MSIKHLRYWVQKVLPLVYDDSLSYYELLNKVVVKLNEVIELANGLDEKITEDVQNIMDEWLSDGTFERLINEQALSGLTDRITEAEGDIDTLQDNVGTLDDKVAELESKPSAIVTPQSLGYPDTKTADEAFAMLAEYENLGIIIPDGTYNLTNIYRLNNVIIDDGYYPKFAPIHKRKKYIDLNGYSYNKNVALPAIKSYCEGVCYLNGNYYAIAYNYTSDEYDYLIKYDANFNQILQANISRPASDDYSAHAPSNVYTDGTYIYVDNIRTVSKFNADTLTMIQRWTDLPLIETAYFNGSFWGYYSSGNTLLIQELNNDFTVKETHTVDRKVTTTNQSWTIHNGLIYFTTTTGYFTVVDMNDWSFTNISYERQLEIENIFFVENKMFVAGHSVGAGDGSFNVGEFNGGQPVNYIGRYTFDGNTSNWNLGIANKFGVYDFSNYQVGVFGNSGKMIILDDLIYAVVGDWILVYNGSGWRLAGTKRVISITIANGIAFRIETNGTINLWCSNYALATTGGAVTIACDSSTIFALLGLSDSSYRCGYVFGSTESGLPMNHGVAGARIYVEKTKVTLQPFYVLGTPSAVSLYGSFQLLE